MAFLPFEAGPPTEEIAPEERLVLPRCRRPTTQSYADAGKAEAPESGLTREFWRAGRTSASRPRRDRLHDCHRAPRHVGVQALDHAAVDRDHALALVLRQI